VFIKLNYATQHYAGKIYNHILKSAVMDKTNFNEWYNDVIEKAELSDKRYPVKGMNVWRPYGWKAMRRIDDLIRIEMERTDHGEVNFPLLIPKSEFSKEGDHIKGFDAEVYWVTKCGLNELESPLLLRPTSETAMYPMFSLWVRSHSDLPLKIYQLVNVFRYETKMTKSFIRVREIHFFEAHTAHVDLEDAERQIKEDLEILERFAKKLCIPYLVLRRPDWDKFAGAYYTLGIDALMPDGKTMQLGSIHQYRTNFSEPYDIKYEDEKGEHQFVYQTTYGMAERLLGAIIGIHGDDKGIIFPSDIAPYQIVIVPILLKGKKKDVEAESVKLKKELREWGFRAHLDDRDIRPGAKYYDWELKGVPIRIELGPRDIAEGKVVLVQRDTGEKSFVPRDQLKRYVGTALEDIAENLLMNAEKRLNAGITEIDGIDEGVGKTNILKMYWCGEEDCATEVEVFLELTILGTPPDGKVVDGEEVAGEGTIGHCVYCGKPTETVIYASKTY